MAFPCSPRWEYSWGIFAPSYSDSLSIWHFRKGGLTPPFTAFHASTESQWWKKKILRKYFLTTSAGNVSEEKSLWITTILSSAEAIMAYRLYDLRIRKQLCFCLGLSCSAIMPWQEGVGLQHHTSDMEPLCCKRNSALFSVERWIGHDSVNCIKWLKMLYWNYQRHVDSFVKAQKSGDCCMPL